VEKFGQLGGEWWRPGGGFAALHALNPLRVGFVRRAVAAAGLPSGAGAPLAGLRALDVGCGGGLLSEPLARLGGHVLGLDAAPESVAAARAHLSSHSPDLRERLEYRVATAEELQREEAASGTGGGFDLVVCSEVLEHVGSPWAFCRTLGALLRPGGVLVVSTMSRTPRAYLEAILGAEHLLGVVPRGTHNWGKFVNPEELCRMLETAPPGEDEAGEGKGRGRGAGAGGGSGDGGGLEMQLLTGMAYNPISGRWREVEHTDVNYIASFSHANLGASGAGNAAH